MKCEWCEFEFIAGMPLTDVVKHLVQCFNKMVKEYKNMRRYDEREH